MDSIRNSVEKNIPFNNKVTYYPVYNNNDVRFIFMKSLSSSEEATLETEDYTPLQELRGGAAASTSTESMASLQLKLTRQHSSYRFFEWRPWLILAWTLHFLGCICIVVYGSIRNHGERKYIPVDVNALEEECIKGFIDVFSPSIDAPGAFVCCSANRNNPFICNPPPRYLLFASRLARFPDAWLLPLFPLFLRGALQLFRNSTSSYTKSENAYARRRFYLYLLLIQIRAWVLYLFFDWIEDILVATAEQETSCWYEKLLHHNYSSCQGRVTDFSDHVVLYFAQILPLALTEVLHSFVFPFWTTTSATTTTTNNNKSATITTATPNGTNYILPIILLAWLANLYFVTFLGAYKTAVYFHTGPEIFTGYVISLFIQIPLFLLQCTDIFPRAREYFYGHELS